jgi:excisionase family DNA binding protein
MNRERLFGAESCRCAVTVGLQEISDAVAELREAEMMLKGVAASQIIAAENGKPTNGENPRLACRIDEAAKLLGLSRKTIERRIAYGSLASTKRLGTRLVSAASVRALFEPGE